VPPSRTPLVMVFESQSKTICLINQGQRGTSIFLTPNPGTTNVTLLGDALHNMPPYRGVGANAALWDAALLRDTIVEVARGDCSLLGALSGYERRMIAHGFRAVRTSLAAMTQFHEENRVSRSLTKAFLRAADRVPPLRALMFAGR